MATPTIEYVQHKVRDALLHAATHLEPSLVSKLEAMEEQTNLELRRLSDDDPRRDSYAASADVLAMIRENLELSGKTRLPMCQDTGMVVFFVEMGPKAPFGMHMIEQILHRSVQEAVKIGNFRNSVVFEPLFERKNTGTNLPPVIHWFTKPTGGITIRAMLKGFGSENCSSLHMLNPTAQEEQVLEAVVRAVQSAGGKPCPPIVVGVGLGGTAERADQLSKRALCRPVGEPHPDPRYAALEQRMERAVNDTHVGPGGFGGPFTALAVAVEYEPTHIAGLPLAISISCWADRKAVVEIEGGEHA